MIKFDNAPNKRLNTSPKKMSPLERIIESFQWDDTIADRSLLDDEEGFDTNKDNYFIADTNIDEESIFYDIILSNKELVEILIEMSFDIYTSLENYPELNNGKKVKGIIQGDDVYVFYKYSNTQPQIEGKFCLACILRTENLQKIDEVVVCPRTLTYILGDMPTLEKHKFHQDDITSSINARMFWNLAKVYDGKVSIFGQKLRNDDSKTGHVWIGDRKNPPIPLRKFTNKIFSILNKGITYYVLQQNDEELITFKDLVYNKKDHYELKNIGDYKAISFFADLDNSENAKHRMHQKFLDLKNTFTYGISYSNLWAEHEWQPCEEFFKD